MIFQEGPVPSPQSATRTNRKQYPLCLVLAPTRELASQIYDEARKVIIKTSTEGEICIYASYHCLVRVSIDGSFVCSLWWS